jgi:C-terminus of AA_permease
MAEAGDPEVQALATHDGVRLKRRAASDAFLMLELPLDTWIRFLVWLAIGLAVYLLYGAKHSRLAVPSGIRPVTGGRDATGAE